VRQSFFSQEGTAVIHSNPLRHAAHLGAVCGLLFGFAPSAWAESGNFELELNIATDVADACRLTFVATNNTGIALTQNGYEVAAFDATGVVSAILVLELGQLPLNKTRVVQFDLPNMKCADISRLLVNGQDSCESTDGTHDICMKALNASSRVQSIPFGI